MAADVEPVQHFGRYEIIRPLARGGMAELFLARRVGPEGVEKRLCIKKIRPELARDRRFLELFIAEARVSTSLTHGNIVQVFDFGRAGDDYYLAMEYVPGRDLGAVLRALRATDRRLAPALAAHVVSEVCHALDYAHRQRDRGGQPLGLVHRDVTPRNVLVSWDGEVKLADFGVTRVGEPLVGGVRGTPPYMAPEQARGEAMDARADLFALGLVLLETLRGERAYRADTPAAQLEQARRAEVPAAPADAPPALGEVVAHATARDPAVRFATALEMQTALERYLKGVHDAPSPSRALAALLAELFPGEGDEPDREHPAATAAPGARTALSLAGTVGETLAPPAAGPPAAATSTRARRAVVAAAVVAGLAVAGVVALQRGLAGPSTRPPAPLHAPPAPASMPTARPTPAPAATARPTPAPAAAAPAVAPPPPAQAAATERRPAPPRLGRLDLNCTPWCEVFVDGRRAGESPLLGYSLPAGRHPVRVRNPQLGITRTLAVEIRAGEITRQLVDLAAPP